VLWPKRNGIMMMERNGGEFAQVTVSTAKEVDADGKPVGTTGGTTHSFDALATQNYTFSTPSAVVYQKLSVTQIELSAEILNKTKVLISTAIFEEPGTIINDGEACWVGLGAMKFSIQISNWDWCGGACNASGAYIDISFVIKGKKPTPVVIPGLSGLKSTKTVDYDLGGNILSMSSRVH